MIIMAENLRYWRREPTMVKMTGKWLTDFSIKISLGNPPEISFTVYLEAMIESLPKDVLTKLRKHITDILIDDIHIGVKPVPIFRDGKKIGEMWSEVV